MLDNERPELPHLPLPDGPVTKTWVSARLKELRAEMMIAAATG